jgi:MFS family permease
LVSRLADRIAPRSLGTSFRWLWAASVAGNLGDGLLLAVAPLLVASLTSDPFAIALAVFMQRLPWLLFGLAAGVVVDRVDRRLLSAAVDLARALVVGVLTVTVATGTVNVVLVYAVVFLLGTAETLADNAATALVADVVPPHELGIANARLIGSIMVTNQLAGPPIGAALFGIGVALPFGTYAACLAASAVLITRMRIRPAEAPRPQRRALRHEIAEGLMWLWRHPPIRTLAETIVAFNITFGAAMAVYVLYAKERLGVGDLGFGLLLSATAVGGVVGAACYGTLARWFSLATLMRAGLIIETCTHLALALTRSPIVAGLVMFVFGVHAAVWGSTSLTVRQRAVPSRLLGRVNSVYLLGSIGAIAIGTLLGGALAQRWGVTAPLWFAFIGSAVITVVMWRTFLLIAHAAELPGDADGGDSDPGADPGGMPMPTPPDGSTAPTGPSTAS